MVNGEKWGVWGGGVLWWGGGHLNALKYLFNMNLKFNNSYLFLLRNNSILWGINWEKNNKSSV